MSRRPEVGVGCIVTRENRDLLLMRRNSPYGNASWSTPGGFLEFGESLETCAAREAKEETGADVHGIRFFAVTNDIFEEYDRHFITVWMVAEYDGDNLQNSDESTDVGWFPRDNLPKPLFLPFSNLLANHGLPS